LPQFILEPGVADRRRRETGEAEGAFHDQHRGEQFPGLGPDLRADDAGVEEVFELVDDDEITERGDGDERRVRQADDEDDGVRDQVADHRQGWLALRVLIALARVE